MIDNPYKGLEHIGYNYLHDCKSAKIPVPCGNCPSCIALRQSYFIQRCQMQSLDNHLFMMTLTYNQQSIPRLKVNERTLYYPDFKDPQNMFKRLRKKGLIFSYLLVSEYGGKNHRPHFHCIVSVPKSRNDTYLDIKNLEFNLYNVFLNEWQRNYGSRRKPKFKPLCTLVRSHNGYTYDFHYIDPACTKDGEADVAFYVTKYLLKADKWVDSLKSALKLNLEPEKFEEVWKLLKPRCCVSKGFGSPFSDNVSKHIKKGISFSKASESLFPYYISPIDGSTYPLAPYFQKKFLTMSDKKYFWELNGSTGVVVSDEINPNMEKFSDQKLEKIRATVNSRLNTFNTIYDVDESENILPETLEKNLDHFDCVDDCWSDYNEFEE